LDEVAFVHEPARHHAVERGDDPGVPKQRLHLVAVLPRHLEVRFGHLDVRQGLGQLGPALVASGLGRGDAGFDLRQATFRRVALAPGFVDGVRGDYTTCPLQALELGPEALVLRPGALAARFGFRYQGPGTLELGLGSLG
jgi:hypothetical protein